MLSLLNKKRKVKKNMEKELTVLNSKLQTKKNELRKLLGKKGVLQKDKSNTYDNYKYFSEAGYKKLFTELLSQVGLELTTSIIDVARYSLEGKQPNGRLIQMKVTLSDIETGFSEETIVFGEGIDKGDKALYKAYTGAIKYYLADTFLVATGDDPEVDSPEGKEQIKYTNKEIELKQYNSFIDDYFFKKPEQKLAFLEKYKIKKLTDIDTKLSMKQLDELITSLKKAINEADINSQEETF